MFFCSFSESPRRARQKLVLQPMKFFLIFFSTFFFAKFFFPFPPLAQWQKKILGQIFFSKKKIFLWTIGGLFSRFGEPDSKMKLKFFFRHFFFFFCPIPGGVR